MAGGTLMISRANNLFPHFRKELNTLGFPDIHITDADKVPKLNITVLALEPFPDKIATWFVFHGIKNYIKLLDGFDEFHRGLRCVLNGKTYIAPDVERIIDTLSEWPDVSLKETRRQKEILLMLCKGFSIKQIEDCLHIGRVTVEYHIKDLKRLFNCDGREELINVAHCLDIFPREALCSYDTSHKKVTLPDWAKTQQHINRRIA